VNPAAVWKIDNTMMAGRKIAIVASCARFAGTIVIQVATTVTNFGITR
jgi:hypothetical protein